MGTAHFLIAAIHRYACNITGPGYTVEIIQARLLMRHHHPVVCLQLQAAQAGLLNLIPQLEALSVVLPPETLAWKLELLREGSRKVNKQLKSVQQRVLLLTSDQDLLLPSREEGPRLAKALPRCNHKVRASKHLRNPCAARSGVA